MENLVNPVFSVTRADKERLLGQRGLVVWLYGLSGAGKSTLANELSRALHQAGRLALNLDGDVLRNGLNRGLGFTEQDRMENLRRAAEVARLSLETGSVVVCSFITPLNTMRRMVRNIIPADDLLDVYVRCSYSTCAARDVKGLYAKAKANTLANFTGKDSAFEEPETPPALLLDTDQWNVTECTSRLVQAVLTRVAV
jgi:adenylylsulfate kinase